MRLVICSCVFILYTFFQIGSAQFNLGQTAPGFRVREISCRHIDITGAFSKFFPPRVCLRNARASKPTCEWSHKLRGAWFTAGSAKCLICARKSRWAPIQRSLLQLILSFLSTKNQTPPWWPLKLDQIDNESCFWLKQNSRCQCLCWYCTYIHT